MNLVKRQTNPPRATHHPLWSLQSEMNTLFDQFFGGDTPPAFNVGSKNWPSIEVKEEETQYKINAEVPGVADKDIHVTLTNNALEISGERKNEYKEDNDRGYFSEISYGRFFRSIPFDQEVDQEKVTAKMKDGLLQVIVGKSAKGKSSARKIEISH